jgi:hypothetical protein
MINFRNESVAAGFSVDDAIDLVFAFGNPNPDRCGCPAPAIVQALAVRALPIGHPGYEHLVCCSPCYREFRALQRRCGQCRPNGSPKSLGDVGPRGLRTG